MKQDWYSCDLRYFSKCKTELSKSNVDIHDYSLTVVSIVDCLENVIHNGWLGALTMLSSFSDVELGMVYMKDHRSSWMKRILNSILFSKMISVSSLFFWMFCKNYELALLTTKWIDLLLFLQNSWYFFACHFLLNLYFQNRHILLSAWCSPL